MRQYLIAVIAVFCFVQSEATSVARPTFAGEPEFLSGTEGHAVFRQCSRSAPNPSRVLPPPSKTEIESLEPAVERYIAEEYEANRASPPNTITYNRQYVAYEKDGQRMIFGNYFPMSLRRPQGQAVVVCDGGSQFWGITFNPKTRKVESLSMNGSV